MSNIVKSQQSAVDRHLMSYHTTVQLFFVISFLTISTTVFAQDYKKQYKQAKDLFAAENYSAAMDAFRPLMIYDRSNPYPEYAGFYYALSAHRLGFSTIAKEMFLQTKNIYPQWDQLEEVNYWLIKIALEQREYFRALSLAQQIKETTLKTDIEAMKRIAFSKEEDVETLRMLREENPYDSEVAKALAFAIGKKFQPADTLLLDSIATQFGWSRKDFIVVNDQPLFKDKYKVALLLPFIANTLDAGPSKKRSQFVLDLYEGMKQAADSLAGEGIHIDLLAYDTEHDQDAIKKLLKEEELKSADLIIGPLLAEDSKLVHEFSMENKINTLVNPLSYNIDLIGKNPQSFIFQPSHKTIGEKSAEMLASKVRNKNCFVFFGESPKDSLMAFSFMRMATSLGMKIAYAEEVRPETSTGILETLAKATEFDEWKNPKQFKLKRDSIGSIFVASDDALIYTKIINSVETRGDSIQIVGQESWIEDNSVDLTKLEKTKILFAAPNFSPVKGKSYREFRRKYLQMHGTLPGAYAQKGYECIMVLGRALKKYGVYFQQGLELEGIPGALTSGYQMTPLRDNGRVSFISFIRGKLEPIDRP